MAESIYLHGSDDVRSAANTMRNAAEEMNRAASNMDSAFDRHQRFLESWLQDFRTVLEEHRAQILGEKPDA